MMKKINLIAMLCMLLCAGVVQAEEPVSAQATLAEATQELSIESQNLAANFEAALAPYRDALIASNNHYQAVKLNRSLHGDAHYTQQQENEAYANAESSYSALQNAVNVESQKAVLASETAAKNDNP
jgi:hypothetical protein